MQRVKITSILRKLSVVLAVFVLGYSLTASVVNGQIETLEITRTTPPPVPGVGNPPTPPQKPEPTSPPNVPTPPVKTPTPTPYDVPTPTPTDPGITPTPTTTPTPTSSSGDGGGGTGGTGGTGTSSSSGGESSGGVSPAVLGLSATSGKDVFDNLLSIDNWKYQTNFDLFDIYPERIAIPDIGLDVQIKPAQVIDGYWEVFDNSASFGIGSLLPGQGGNSVVFAHRRQGLFLPLVNAKVGMDIQLSSDNKNFDYKVAEVKEVKPDDLSVIQSSNTERLTLFTCSGPSDSTRLVVIAVR